VEQAEQFLEPALTMQTSVITPADLPVSGIGLGCVTFGREIDEPAAHVLLDHAVANGIRFFDTAVAYAQGASESIIGRWLASLRPAPGTVTVATKILPPYEPERLANIVDASMQRLGVPAIDLLYLHRWDATAESPASLAALDSLVRSGRVRALGVSNYSREQLETALALQERHGWERFSVVQNNHNLAVSDVSADLRSFCAARQIAIVTYSPLGAGFLTGKHRRGVPAGTRFDLVPGHQDVYFHDKAWRRLARLESVAARTGHTPSHLALAWALHQPGIASVLVGGRSPAHLDQALAAQFFDDPATLAALTTDREEIDLSHEDLPC
jgi:1-deoxyxylulose-5-phosphate synthase